MSNENFCSRLFAVLQISALFFSFCQGLFAQNETTKTPQTIYSNTTPITINTTSGLTAPTKATLYPSTIDVSGMTGTITRVAVTLDGINNRISTDMDFLLVSPSGAKFVFLSDCCGNDDKIYTFADDAAATPSSGAASGTYKPVNGDNLANDTFPVPAPAGPYNFPPSATFASVYNGAVPNGTWSLYAADDTLSNPGSINSGLSLTITTDGAPATFTNSNYIGLNDILATSAPYGTAINVSGVDRKSVV